MGFLKLIVAMMAGSSFVGLDPQPVPHARRLATGVERGLAEKVFDADFAVEHDNQRRWTRFSSAQSSANLQRLDRVSQTVPRSPGRFRG